MSAENALADLGLDLGGDATETPVEAPVATETVTETDTSEGKRTFSTIKLSDGDISIDEEGDELPATERKGFGGGNKGSKYPFEKLGEPTVRADGVKLYKSFAVRVPEGEDYERVRRSVQSAASSTNATHEKAGEPNYYVTRQFVQNGEVVGVKVYRTDERPDKKAE